MSVVPSHPSMHPSSELAVSMMKLFQPMFTCDQTETVVVVETDRRGFSPKGFDATDINLWGKCNTFRWSFRRIRRHAQWEGMLNKSNTTSNRPKAVGSSWALTGRNYRQAQMGLPFHMPLSSSHVRGIPDLYTERNLLIPIGP